MGVVEVLYLKIMFAHRMEHIPFSGIRDVFEECNRLESEGRDIVHLEIGRPDFDTPEPIKEAAIQALSAGEVHYTSNWGIRPLREEIQQKFEHENGLRYSADDEIVVTTGATEAVLITILALVDVGDEVLIPDICWTYEPAIRMVGGIPVRYRLDPEAGFQPDGTSLSEAVSDDTSLLVVNSPHNPTGSMLTPESVATIAELAVKEDLYVLSDEIYEKITYDEPHESLATVDGLYDRTVTVNGFSKAFSMTGWRLGYLAAPRELVDPIIRVRQYTTTCAPSFVQHGGVRALNDESLWRPLVDAFAERRELVVDRIEAIPELSVSEPDGAFYAMPTIPTEFNTAEAFTTRLLREAGVATVPGTVFGPGSERRFRIAYSNSTDRIETAFDRIEEWLHH
jgi:aspartate/methionine/tyrosine aminotransferase